ncbi:hypothetical protein GBA52_008330 [Prunus armeniaca]|nr:hypothetical protein GBA52_008330 [Prunus armeniaca]
MGKGLNRLKRAGPRFQTLGPSFGRDGLNNGLDQALAYWAQADPIRPMGLGPYHIHIESE